MDHRLPVFIVNVFIVFIVNLCVAVVILAQTSMYTTFDEHDHVDVHKKFEFYTCIL